MRSGLFLCALVLCLFAELSGAHAECPPQVDDQQMESALNQCQNWICDVDYNPAGGVLPQYIPNIGQKWQLIAESYEDPITGDINEVTPEVTLLGKLLIEGLGVPTQPGEIEGAMYYRQENILQAPETNMFVMQFRYKVAEILDSTMQLEGYTSVAGGGVMDDQRLGMVNLGLMKEGMATAPAKWVVLGEGGIPATPSFDESDDFVMSWDWTQETTYTEWKGDGHYKCMAVGNTFFDVEERWNCGNGHNRGFVYIRGGVGGWRSTSERNQPTGQPTDHL